MNRIDIIKDKSFMVLSNIAVILDSELLYAINLKNINQRSIFIFRPDSIILKESNMSEANKYKSIAIIERNKERLLKEHKKWVNIQKKE